MRELALRLLASRKVRRKQAGVPDEENDPEFQVTDVRPAWGAVETGSGFRVLGLGFIGWRIEL